MFSLFKKKPTLSGGRWKMTVIFPGGVESEEKYIITRWKRTDEHIAEVYTEDGRQIMFCRAKFIFEEL